MTPPAPIDALASFFDAAAADWDTQSPPAAQTCSRLDALRDDLGLRAGMDLLEVGCGTGQTTEWLSCQVAPGRVTAVDISEAMLRRAQARGDSAAFRQVDVCVDHLGVAEFDVAFCLHVFPHFRDVQAALANLRRSLRPGGRLLILHLAHWREINELHDRIGGAVAGHHLPAPGDWESLIRGSGFRLMQLRDELKLLLVVAEPC